MENKIQTEKMVLRKEKLSVTAEQVVENDISLPDYYGDIVKILGQTSRTNITSVGITGDKAIAEGSVEAGVLYLNGEGKTELYCCSYPFSRSVDIKDPEPADTVRVEVTNEQISCRAVNKRRADLRGSVALKFTVVSKEEREVVTGAEDDFCHTLKSSVSGNFFCNSTVKSFYISEKDDINGDIKVKKVYRTSAIPVVTDVKSVKNKMLIKGSVAVDIVSLCDNDAFATQRVNVPVNQIIDMENIDETSKCCVTLSCMSINVKTVADGGDDPSSFDVSLVMAAVVDAYDERTVELVTDAYSPDAELISDTGSIRYISSLSRVNENFTLTENIDLSACSGSCVYDVAVRKIRYSVSTENDKLLLKGNVNFCIIAGTDNNEKVYIERTADFEYTKQLTAEYDDVEFMPHICLNAVNCSVDNNRVCSVTAELHIDGFLLCIRESNCVVALEKGKELPGKSDDTVITVYFASRDEKLWDIAKKHGSSVEDIKRMNGLETDTLGENMMLIF